MIKDIVKDIMFLQRKSVEATIDDVTIGEDLLDTLKHHSDHCVGLAANMIGETKKIIAINDNGRFMVMFNPVIKKHSPKMYSTEEGCLSLAGIRETKRYEMIEVQYYNQNFKKKQAKFTSFTAQIIQHEMDHLEGVLI